MKQPAQTTTSAAPLTPRTRRLATRLPQRFAASFCVGGLAGCLALSTVHAQSAEKAQARAEQPHAPAPVKPASPGATTTAAPAEPTTKAKAASPAKKAQVKTGPASQAKPATADKAPTPPPSAATSQPEAPPVAATPTAPIVQPKAAEPVPVCRLADNEQPRGGRLDVVGDRFGTAPVVRIAGKPARMLVRKQDRISVQVPADSNGGEITLLNDGKVFPCGTLVIIGKDR